MPERMPNKQVLNGLWLHASEGRHVGFQPNHAVLTANGLYMYTWAKSVGLA